MSVNIQTESVSARKRLEWELSLSWSDIRSHAWFHGSISRSRAERLLETDGQFLVRECSSRSGDYVLSCLHDSHALHFVISKAIQRPDTVYERIQFHFEDEYFDTINDLITFYVGNKRPVSLASGAVIASPVNRTQPLTDFKQILNKFNSNDNELSFYPKNQLIVEKNNNNNNEYNSIVKKEMNGSHESDDSAFFSDSFSPKQTSGEEKSQTNERQLSEKSFDSFKSLTIPPKLMSTTVRAQEFHTYLLPKDNKPLDSTAILKIHSVLTDTGARILANHLLDCDLDFIGHKDQSRDFGLGIGSALELILVPHGRQMRSDLIERHRCLKYFVLITILTTINERMRALVLNKWIEIAVEVKTALGDLFGFSAIMEALSTSTMVEMKSLWSIIRKDFTQNAIIYETKLRPQFKAMIDCIEPQAPNTTFPFILTLIQILERHSNVCENKLETKVQSLDFPFEQTTVDYGLQTIFSHLESAQTMIDQLLNFRRNAKIVFDGIQHLDQLLTDLFRTQFHRQFLFGFRGSVVESDERFVKLDQIVKAFARKAEPDIDSSH